MARATNRPTDGVDGGARPRGPTHRLHRLAARPGARRPGRRAPDRLRGLDVLDWAGPISAGDLAKRVGATSGAITGVIDRLERDGWVRRRRDPTTGGR